MEWWLDRAEATALGADPREVCLAATLSLSRREWCRPRARDVQMVLGYPLAASRPRAVTVRVV
jgi:hypothetical protein